MRTVGMKRITAPSKEFTGRVGAVMFVDGQAETDDVAVIGYCEGAGYKVEDAETPEGSAKTPSRSGSKAEWVAHAIGAGLTEAEADGMTRDQLAEKFLGPKGSE